MSAVIASNVPKTVSLDKVKEFFAFSGKVDTIDVQSSTDRLITYKVSFVSPEAVSNALLLNGAELDGQPIDISEEGSSGSSQATSTTGNKAFTSGITPGSSSAAAAASVPFTDAGVAANEKSTAQAQKDAPVSDIDQEQKPKSAVIAEYLSHGYVLSDQALDKAVALDKKHGISEKFKNFLASLDSKYHVQDKAVETNQKYGLDQRLAKGRTDLSSYFDNFSQTATGSKINAFYSDIVRDSKQIHQEARRLADLKKGQEGSTGTNTNLKE